MKTKEELNAMKEETKPKEKGGVMLTDEELEQVSGGTEVPTAREYPVHEYLDHDPEPDTSHK